MLGIPYRGPIKHGLFIHSLYSIHWSIEGVSWIVGAGLGRGNRSQRVLAVDLALVLDLAVDLAEPDYRERVVSGIASYSSVFAFHFQRLLYYLACLQPGMPLISRLQLVSLVPIINQPVVGLLRALALVLDLVSSATQIAGLRPRRHVRAHSNDGAASLVLPGLPHFLVLLGHLVDVHVRRARRGRRLRLIHLVHVVHQPDRVTSFP